MDGNEETQVARASVRACEMASAQGRARRRRRAEGEAFDAGFGYGRYDKRALRAAAANAAAKTEPGARKEAAAAAAAAASGGGRRGWIFNMLPTVSFELVFVLEVYVSWCFVMHRTNCIELNCIALLLH